MNLHPSEDQIHKAFVEYVRLKYPLAAKHLIHIPNEGLRSGREGARQKALGLTKGVPDLFLAKPSLKGDYHGLWIELKSKYGKETPEQKQFKCLMEEAGYMCVVPKSVDEAILAFEFYLRS